MELLSNCSRHLTVPENYVFPPEKRPGNDPVDSSVALPVVDLRGGDRRRTVGEIMEAGREFGFFQVVNHGVAEEVIGGMLGVAEEAFTMPEEDKALYYSDDVTKEFRLASRGAYDASSEARYWVDYLKLTCYPVQDVIHHWPHKPHRFRECLSKYIVEVQELATQLLGMIAEGLGLREDYFCGALSDGRTQMNVNYYPPCPDPSLTLGLMPHCDRHLLTILAQVTTASGLQAKYRGRWIRVDPIPNAFVVNFGHQLEIVTNGQLKSVEHRVVTNSAAARTSVAALIMPRTDCLIAPAHEFVDDHNPPKYRPFLFKDFLSAYVAAAANREAVLEAFKIN